MTIESYEVDYATTQKQDTGNVSLASIDAKLNSLGQKLMANSVPVALASDQSTIPVNRPISYVTGNLTVLNGAVTLTLLEGQSCWDVYLSGTFSSTSQVIFEGSLDNTNWFNVNGRRNTDSTTNDTTTLLDVSPMGGASPSGANPSNWRGNIAGIRFFRVRCSIYTASDNILVQISTSVGTGAVFINASMPTFADKSNSGSISALNGAVTATTIGCSSVSFKIQGTWVGTLIFEGTSDLASWDGMSAIAPSNGALAFSTFSNNNSFVIPCGGYMFVRVRASAYTSGTATVAWDAGAGANAQLAFNPFASSLNAQVVGNISSLGADSGNPVKAGSVFNSTAPAPTNGQRVDLQSNRDGHLAVQFRCKFRNVTGNATTVVKSGAGVLHSVMINNNATNGTVIIYDNTAASGTVIFNFNVGSPSGGLLSTSGQPGPFSTGPLGIEFATGLTIITTGSTSNNVTLIYS